MFTKERNLKLQTWLTQVLPRGKFDLSLLSGDASFRRYLRARLANKSYVVMDAPPEKESTQPFIAIAKTFRQLGLQVPEIFVVDAEQGFLLLSDFGDQLYLDILNNNNVTTLYTKAFEDLLILQTCQHIDNYELPKFDRHLYQQELNLFNDWYLTRYLNINLTVNEKSVLDQVNALLIEDALSQPKICVHRDYHSRNLMLLDNNQVGILDFQDAAWGPITYDLVSLLRDCYIDWPVEKVKQWASQYFQLLNQKKIIELNDEKLFLRWFDWIGLQRHLKCIGIFARLSIRDGKSGYLQDIPRVLKYTEYVCQSFPEFGEFLKVLKNRDIL